MIAVPIGTFFIIFGWLALRRVTTRAENNILRVMKSYEQRSWTVGEIVEHVSMDAKRVSSYLEHMKPQLVTLASCSIAPGLEAMMSTSYKLTPLGIERARAL